MSTCLQSVAATLVDRGHVLLPRFVASVTLTELASSVADAVSAVGTAWVPDADTDPTYDRWASGLEKASDLVFDLSRSATFVDLAEACLGGPVVPLRCAYAASSTGSGPSAWHVDADRYAPHFGRLPALSVCIPLSACGPSIGGLCFRPRPVAGATALADGALARLKRAETDGPVAAEPRDVIVYHALTPHRVVSGRPGAPGEYVLFAYRYSPHRVATGVSLASSP